jgi:hypothetical protein
VLTSALYGIQFLCLVKFGLMHLHYEGFVLFHSFCGAFFSTVSTNWNAMLGDPAEYHGSESTRFRLVFILIYNVQNLLDLGCLMR